MFRLFITFATLLTTGAHALVGCCWHHDHGPQHAACEGEQPTTERETADAHSCSCHHERSTHFHRNSGQCATITSQQACPCGGHQNHNSGSSDPCDEGQCHYLTNAKVELPGCDGFGPFGLLVILPTAKPAELFRVARAGVGGLHGSASSLLGSLCVRDVTQIALI